MIDIKPLSLCGQESTWTKVTRGNGKFFDAELENLGGQAIFRGNLDLEIQSELNYQGSIETLESFLTQSLWYNSLTRIMDKPVFYKSWSNL